MVVRRLASSRARVGFVLAAVLSLGFSSPTSADEVVLVPMGAEWRLHLGDEEASSPDLTEWREPDFDDSDWELAPAPIGYGSDSDGPFATDLSEREPPMRRNYNGVFIRREFEFRSNVDELTELIIRASLDDGMLVWINDQLVIRENIRGDEEDPITIESRALRGREASRPLELSIESPRDIILPGRNVIAVQAFNSTTGSGDFKIDLELIDPFGPDLTAPEIQFVVPGRNTIVRRLGRIQVAFSEPITGFDASDLTIGGSPVTSVTGTGAGPYDVAFDAATPGVVEVVWAEDHGIVDLAEARNALDPSNWHYIVNPEAPPGDIEINEVLSSNSTGLRDATDNANDWVELVNEGDVPVDLAGWSLSDDPANDAKWVFPNHVLEPGDFLVVFASGRDIRDITAEGHFHTNFRLNADGEHLALYSADLPRERVSAFVPTLPVQRIDISYGRNSTGQRVYFEDPTPGEANGDGETFGGIALPPTPSHHRGYYTESFSLSLSTPTPEATIKYTIDGTVPTASNGMEYEGPIEIAGDPDRGVVTVRTVALRDGWLPSTVATHSYFFAEHVLTQPRRPSGFPTSWGNGQTIAADYEMDPDILDDAETRELAVEALLTTPTISVVLPIDDFLGRTRGIYSNGASSGPAWERSASAEIIFGDGKEGDQVNCGLRIQGGSSTRGWKSPKLSMRLLFKGDYGSKKLEYPFFGRGVDRFDTLVLDAGLNLVLSHPSHDQRRRLQYVRDQYVADLQQMAGNIGPRGRFINLFVNGLYWGLYNVHERPDASFQAEHLGGHKSEYDAVRHNSGNVVDGTSASYGAAMTAVNSVGTSADRLAEVDTVHMDVGGHIDYMIANLYAGNDDWAHHNWYAGRKRGEGGLLRYYSWDAEHSLKSVTQDSTGRNEGGAPTGVFHRLRVNPEYQRIFGDHLHRHFFNGGMLFVDTENRNWDPDNPHRNRAAANYIKRIEEVDPAIILETARWGDHYRANDPYTRDGDWLRELNLLLDSYFPNRSRNFLSRMRSTTMRLYPRVTAPVYSQHGGSVGPDTSIDIEADDGDAVWLTTDGTDPRVYGSGEVSATAMSSEGSVSFEGGRTILRSRALDDGNWSALNEAVFYRDDILSDLRITEVSYNPVGDAMLEFVEVTNYSAAPIDLSGARFSEGIDFEFPAGSTLAGGQRIVLVRDAVAFGAVYRDVEPFGVFAGGLNDGGERLTISDDRRALLSVSFNDGDTWPLGPDGFGFTLVSESPELDSSDTSAWRASAQLFGSPGEADPDPVDGGVVINEILSNSTAPLEDAIELYNPTERDVDVGGWFLSDSRADLRSLRRFRIPDGTIVPAGGYHVVYENEFNSRPGDASSFALGSDGEQVYLASADEVRDLTGHIVGFDFPAADDGVSIGRVLTSVGPDYAPLRQRSFGRDSAGSVEEFRRGEGGANALPVVGPLVIHEIHYNPLRGDHEFVEIRNLTGSAVSLFDTELGRGWQLRGLSLRGDEVNFEFADGDAVPANGLLILCSIEPALFRERFSIPASVAIVGPFGGALDNGGERLSLMRPVPAPEDSLAYVQVDRVRYDDDGAWPAEADGQGPTLERIAATHYGNEPQNWAASESAGGTPGRLNSVGTGGNLAPDAFFTATPSSGGAPLTVRFDASSSRDMDGAIESFAWSFGDGSSGSGELITHEFAELGSYEVALVVEDDGGARGVWRAIVTVGEEASGGLQLVGDADQDGSRTVTDAINILNRLFIGLDADLPCEGELNSAGNREVFDINGDDAINISDPVHMLRFLFVGGPPPVAGTDCMLVRGCADVCVP